MTDPATCSRIWHSSPAAERGAARAQRRGSRARGVADLPLRLGPLRAAEEGEAARVLARAFRDTPLNVAVVGGDAARRLRSNAHGMRALVSVARAHGRVVVARRGPMLAGVLVAAPPGCYPLPAPPLGVRVRSLLGQGWRASQRWAQVFDVLRAVHLGQPHWYLGALGVDPREQRRGVGRALLEDWLVEIDREGSEAYLETDHLANVEFYARAGFVVAGQTDVLGARIWRMRRPSRPASRPPA